MSSSRVVVPPARIPPNKQPCGKSDLERPQGGECCQIRRNKSSRQKIYECQETRSSAHTRGATAAQPLFLCLGLAPPHLLGFQVFVEQEEGRLVGLCRAHDGEHSFSRLIVGRLSPSGLAGALQRLAVPACHLTLAIEIRAPDVLRISLILLP
jgi:hypothetical protein